MAQHRDERGRLSPEGQTALKQSEEDRRRALEELMGPEAATEWSLRAGGHANWAANLRGLEVSPDEMRQIAGWKAVTPVAVTVDQRFASRYGVGLDEEQLNAARQAHERTTDDRIRELLGDERYAIMQQANQQNGGSYVQLYDLAERFELPPQVVSQGLQMRQDAEAAGEQIRAHEQLTAAQRRDALRAIQQETRQAVEGLLGADAFYTYQRHGGDWINGLSALNAGR